MTNVGGEIIGRAINIVGQGIGEELREFWKKEYGNGWEQKVNSQLRPPQRTINLKDPMFYFKGIIGTWGDLRESHTPDVMNLAHRLLGKRHMWAHNAQVSNDDILFTLFLCEDMLANFNCFTHRVKVKEIRVKLLRILYGTQEPAKQTEKSEQTEPKPTPQVTQEPQQPKEIAETSPPTPIEPTKTPSVEKPTPPAPTIDKPVRASRSNIKPGSHLTVALITVENFQREGSTDKSWMWIFQTLNNRPEVDGLNFKYWTNIDPPDLNRLLNTFKSLGEESDIAEITSISRSGEPPSSLVGLLALATFDYHWGYYRAQERGEEFKGATDRSGKPFLNLLELHPLPSSE